MKHYWLKEDKLPQKLAVVFSSQIRKEINAIDNYNRNNSEAISQWYDYLDGINKYLSNPVIAWDYTNRFSRFPNGTRFIKDFDFNVGYAVKTNSTTKQPYVYVFMVNLRPEEFGLEIPPTLKENRGGTFSRIISEVINSYLRRNLLLTS